MGHGMSATFSLFLYTRHIGIKDFFRNRTIISILHTDKSSLMLSEGMVVVVFFFVFFCFFLLFFLFSVHRHRLNKSIYTLSKIEKSYVLLRRWVGSEKHS